MLKTMMKPLIFKTIFLVFIFLLSACKSPTKKDNGTVLDFTAKTIDTQPDWSPDGGMIAYFHAAQDSSEKEGIWLLDLQIMEKHFLTEGRLPDWSPDGKKIAYVKNNDIHVIELATQKIIQLTDWGSCFFPSWSPNGKKIAYDTDYGDSKGANAIWIMNVDGSDKKDISEHGTGEWREPEWSLDGTKILHKRYIGVVFPELFLMDTLGGNPIRLTENSFDDRYPCWSSDGRKIAWSVFANGLDNPLSGIWVMNADGTNQYQLVRTENVRVTFAEYPSWSPDGSELVYSGYNQKSDSYTLWLIDADGSRRRPLTTPEN